MAKNKKRKSARRKGSKKGGKKTSQGQSSRLLRIPDDIAILEARTDSKVEVLAEITNAVIPYTVAYDGRVLIKSLVNRREPVEPLTEGVHRLGWAFAHSQAGWSHTLIAVIDGSSTVLEKKSEANKDRDHSVGVAFLVVAAPEPGA